MARPIRNNAEYFTHNADFRNDRRVKAIRANLGIAGYGLTVMLLEVLTDADYTQLDTSELELELLSGDLGVSATEIRNLLQIAEKIGFFSRNEFNYLICDDLNRYLAPVFDKRKRSKDAFVPAQQAQPVKPVVSATETPIPETETTVSAEFLPQAVAESTQSKVKESKEEESKVKESIDNIITMPVFSAIADSDVKADGKILLPTPSMSFKPTDDPVKKEPPDSAPPPLPPEMGDGRLRERCLEYNNQNPGKYKPDLYKAFLRYWCAPIINGAKRFIGKERWEAEKTWLLSGRLATWYENNQNKLSNGTGQTGGARSANFLANQRSREPATDGYGEA